MRLKSVIIWRGLLFFMLLYSCGNSPQTSEVLAVTDHTPRIDGVVTQGEYGFKAEYTGLTLYAARAQESVSFALTAQTQGWVSLGVGSKVMDNAHIIMGFVKGGQEQFKEQIGVGHGHEDLAITESLITEMAVKEGDNNTTLEVELRSSGIINQEQKELLLIVGYSGQDSFTSMHSFRKGIVLKLE
jgi:hypothetical protein